MRDKYLLAIGVAAIISTFSGSALSTVVGAPATVSISPLTCFKLEKDTASTCDTMPPTVKDQSVRVGQPYVYPIGNEITNNSCRGFTMNLQLIVKNSSSNPKDANTAMVYYQPTATYKSRPINSTITGGSTTIDGEGTLKPGTYVLSVKYASCPRTLQLSFSNPNP